MKTTERVRQHLSTCDPRRFNQELVCADLGISPTTLRRRLLADGTGFSALVDAERIRRCNLELQRNREARGKVVAVVCGYTELNSFYRAFMRWHGVCYSEYRRANCI